MSNYSLQDNPDYYLQRSTQLKQSDYSVEVVDIDFSKPETSIVRWHWHEEVEFIYVSSGQVYVTCENENILATQGDIIFINQNTKHFITPADTENSRIQSLIVHPMFIVGFGHLDLERKYLTPILHDRSLKYFYVSVQDKDYDMYYSNVNGALEQFEAREPGFELLTKAALLQVWKHIYDRVQADAKATANPKTAAQDEQRVKQAILFMQEHYMEALTLEDIANSILVSKSECCRCFKRSLSMSPFEYLMKYRILESTKHIHHQKQESISDIASAVGFNNTSYYNKIFKKYMKCTPTEYRNNLKKDLPTLS